MVAGAVVDGAVVAAASVVVGASVKGAAVAVLDDGVSPPTIGAKSLPHPEAISTKARAVGRISMKDSLTGPQPIWEVERQQCRVGPSVINDSKCCQDPT